MGRTTEGDCEKTLMDTNAQHTTPLNKFETMLLAVNPATAYHVVGSVRGRDVRFMLDTGAAISLISDQTWRSIDSGKTSLANWDGHKLVGIKGSAIPILGVATVEFVSLVRHRALPLRCSTFCSVLIQH